MCRDSAAAMIAQADALEAETDAAERQLDRDDLALYELEAAFAE